MDVEAVLAEFDRQVRRNTEPDGTGAVYERRGLVIRRLAPAGQGGSGIFWSGLGAADADQVIATELEFFAGRGESFEWKLYDYDKPADLGDRLAVAGFVADGPESVMFAETGQVLAALSEAGPPAGVRVEGVTSAVGVRSLAALQAGVFGRPHVRREQEMMGQVTAAPGSAAFVVALVGEEPVAGGRIDFVPGADFAGLYGGATAPRWRHHGIYRALIRYRAELAASLGYRYLFVDAAPTSRPILERCGFVSAAVTTPCNWSPASA